MYLFFTLECNFSKEIVAQSWEVEQKFYFLLIKVPKIRVVFGYFRGRTDVY